MLFTPEMIISGVILCLTFAGIFTEHFHGIDRAKFAMAGAGAIVIAGQLMGFYSPDLALAAIDWNVVLLLACMMVVVSIMVSTGGFERMAQVLAKMGGRSQLKLAILLGSAVMVISALLDNVTTVIIFGPLIILICRQINVSPVPYLITAAMLSNIGGVATLVGDPPNLMIGSAAKIDFNTFFIHMGPPVLLVWVGILFAIRMAFRKELATPIEQAFHGEIDFKNRRLWNKSLCVMAAMVVLFVIHDKIDWLPWMVAGACLTALVFMSRKVDLEQATASVETPLLMFFVALFIVIGGVEHSGLLGVVGDAFKPIIIGNPLAAALLLLWVAAILSALIDNIPFTAAMIPVLTGLEAQGVNVSVMWWALALGVGMGGNGSHIGATANVYMVTISERLARESGHPHLAITPMLWLRKSTPVTFVALLICTLFIWIAYDFLYLP